MVVTAIALLLFSSHATACSGLGLLSHRAARLATTELEHASRSATAAATTGRDAPAAPRLVGAAMAFDIARGPNGDVGPGTPSQFDWNGATSIPNCRRHGLGVAEVDTGSRQTTSPPPRTWAGMAYGRGAIVRSFCSEGVDGEPYQLSTTPGTWDGSNWSQRHPIASPPPAALPVLVYHAKLGRVVALVMPQAM